MLASIGDYTEANANEVALRQWWNQYLAALAKSGSESIAMGAAKVTLRDVREAKARHPHFAKRCLEAAERGALAQAQRVPGRGKGRPSLVLTRAQKQTLLGVYAETGSTETAAALLGVCLATIARLRKRDSGFDDEWRKARDHAAAVTELAGAWCKRESLFLRMIGRDASLDDACRASGVSPWLGALLANRRGEQARRDARRYPNRFRPPSKPSRASHVRAAASVSHLASQAELEALEASAAIERARAAMTPEMLAFVGLVVDDGLTIEAACERTGRTRREVTLWEESNAFFRIAIY